MLVLMVLLRHCRIIDLDLFFLVFLQSRKLVRLGYGDWKELDVYSIRVFSPQRQALSSSFQGKEKQNSE
jgi:hypothetical protein